MVFQTSCETNVENVELPEFLQKLVITSFISPSDTVSYFSVSSNKKLYGELNTEEPLGNLVGYISDGENEVTLDTFRTGFKLKHDIMQIQYGKTYHLRISSVKGLSCEAYCTVPEKMNFNMKVDTFSIPLPYDWAMEKRRIDIKISIQDIPGTENYYRIFSKGIGYYKDPYNFESYSSTNFLYFENELISDNGMDGKEIVQKSLSGINYYFQHDSAYIVAYLFNTERSYFLYHKSLKDYKNGENPFSEATPVFSNINGGLGIFTSYTVDSLVMRLK